MLGRYGLSKIEGRLLVWFTTWFMYTINLGHDLTSSWVNFKAGRSVVVYLLRFAFYIMVPTFKITSVFGFSLLICMIMQIGSGILLSVYYLPDSSLVMTLREEYGNEVWSYFYIYKAHVVGVDCIFTLSYLHIFKKIYIKNFVGSDLDGWATGVYAFLIYHVVVFLGITLSSNHLGDLTLTIAANIFWSILLFKHKSYAILFTNKHLNVDQLIRFMIGHYVIAWYYFQLVQLHIMFIHEMWDYDSGLSSPQSGNTPKISWVYDALQREAAMSLVLYTVTITFFTSLSHPDSKPVNFYFFEQWSQDEVEDINFFIVGPHWYFRPHMGLLTICAQHYEGLFWLGLYYVLLALLPLWNRLIQPHSTNTTRVVDFIPTRDSLVQQSLFVFFVMSVFYVCGTLPCARFYYDCDEGAGGNSLLRVSYQYIYCYLAVLLHWSDKLEKTVILIK